MMKWLKPICAVALAIVATSCELGGVSLPGSMVGTMTPVQVVPEGRTYLLSNQLGLGDPPTVLGTSSEEFGGGYSILEISRDEQGLRVAANIPVGQAPDIDDELFRDVKYIFAVPRAFQRYFIELSGRETDGSRVFVGMFAERRCEQDACAMAVAADMGRFIDYERAAISTDTQTLECRRTLPNGSGPASAGYWTPEDATPERVILSRCHSQDLNAFRSLMAQMEGSGVLSSLEYDDHFLVYRQQNRPNIAEQESR